jgi:hypothetical protein
MSEYRSDVKTNEKSLKSVMHKRHPTPERSIVFFSQLGNGVMEGFGRSGEIGPNRRA